jgi:hypothetical protein
MWEKKGLVYSCDILGTGYAQDPFIDIIDDKIWRIYFTSRTKDVVSLPFYMDVEAGNPFNILNIHKEPLFIPGYPAIVVNIFIIADGIEADLFLILWESV